MPDPRPVSRKELLVFPVIGLFLCCFLAPASIPLLGTFFFGNLMKVSGVVDRLAQTARNAIIDTATIFLGLTVGASTQADVFSHHEVGRHLCTWRRSLQHRDSLRCALCQTHEPCFKRKNQPVARRSWRVRGSRVCQRSSCDGPERRPIQLPADACHGVQLFRSYRIRDLRRYPVELYCRITVQGSRFKSSWLTHRPVENFIELEPLNP